MVEGYLMAHAGNDAARSRLRYLIDQAPPEERLRSVTAAGSAPPPRRRAGLTLERAQAMMDQAAEWDGSMGAG